MADYTNLSVGEKDELLGAVKESIAATEQQVQAAKKELEEAQLRAFKQLDAPLAPSARGKSGFISGVSEAERQKFRDGLLSCSPADLASAAKKYLAGVPPAIAVVGSSEKAPLGDSEWINLDAQGNPRAS